MEKHLCEILCQNILNENKICKTTFSLQDFISKRKSENLLFTSLGKAVLWHLLDQGGLGGLGSHSYKKITNIPDLKGTREIGNNVLQDWCQIYVLNQTWLIIIAGSFVQPRVKIDVTIIC